VSGFIAKPLKQNHEYIGESQSLSFSAPYTTIQLKMYLARVTAFLEEKMSRNAFEIWERIITFVLHRAYPCKIHINTLINRVWEKRRPSVPNGARWQQKSCARARYDRLHHSWS